MEDLKYRYILHSLMGLEIITDEGGRRLASKIRLQDSRVLFVRGEVYDERVHLVVEKGMSLPGFRRRFDISTDILIFMEPDAVELAGSYHIDHLLFGSRRAEDRFYNALAADLYNKRITELQYLSIRDKLDERLKMLHKELFDDWHLNAERMLAFDLLAAGSTGVAKMLKQKRTADVVVALLYAAASFGAMHLIQRFYAKQEMIDKHRIKPDDTILGRYLVRVNSYAGIPSH